MHSPYPFVGTLIESVRTLGRQERKSSYNGLLDMQDPSCLIFSLAALASLGERQLVCGAQLQL